MLTLFCDNLPIEESSIDEWQAVEFSCMPREGAEPQLLVGGVELEAFLRPGDASWRWRWNPQNTVGRVRVQLNERWPDGIAQTRCWAIEVLPRKIDRERYAELLADLQNVARALVYSTGAVAGARTQRGERATLLEAQHSLFGTEFEPFAAAVERIAQRAPTRVRGETRVVEISQLRDIGGVRDWRDVSKGGREAAFRSEGSAPTQDSYENRLLRRVLDELWRWTAELLADPSSDNALLVAAQTRLRNLRRLPLFAEVGVLQAYQRPSAILRRDAEYRAVYRMWQRLRGHPLLDIDTSRVTLPIAELPELYERWCALALAAALTAQPGWQIVVQHAIEGGGTTWQISIPTKQPLLELATKCGWSMRLHYQPHYRPNGAGYHSLDRHTRVPDLVIEVRHPNHPAELLLFDAKYRLDLSGEVPESALADAYTYLGAIGEANGRRVVRFAMLLYPGSGEARCYASGAGAIPLLPGNGIALRRWLAMTLAQIPLADECRSGG
jgi:large subunit ribosomal protein MRP49